MAAAPLINPGVMTGQYLSVVLFQMLLEMILAVSHAMACPLFSQYT